MGAGDDFFKSEDRYKEFIASELPLAKAFADCWEHMRTETGALAGSIFEAAAKDAPGQPPAEDIPQHGTGKPRLERLCTRARMRLRHAGAARRMALLPHDDPLREAFDLDIPSDFFITIPDARLKCSSLDVPTMVACYMGIEDPLLVEHRTHVFKDRNTTRGNLFRSVDPYGRSLSLYMGPGHARFALHDAIEAVAHQVARLVGFHAVRQPTDLVAHAIKPENRERFMGAQRAAAKSHRGGLIPDLVILRFYLASSDGLPVTRTYDVKTIGYSEKYYRASIARGRAADIRAAEVPADYETKARKVDAEYNGWPYQRGGPPGPVLTLLRSLPPVTGLGVGFAGEFSRDVGQFISAVAEKGTVVPERFGCCHGSDQARGVIASFVRRAFGRTSLRGVARTRQAALAAILGGATRADSFADGGMAGAENAWDASGGHVHGGTPPQL